MAKAAKKTSVEVVDMFCGSGGTSLGFTRAAIKRGLTPKLLAINHWPTAISSHSANLSFAQHLCMSLDHINPREAVPSGHLDLLLASPECTHHSTAAGGRPKNEQSRATAWHVVKWLQELDVDAVLVENVPEFLHWGRLTKAGKVDKRYKGETFLAWVKVIESLGYRVEWKLLTAADYGDATTRRRLFIQAKKKPGKITWPEPTHIRPSEITTDLFGTNTDRKPWRGAKEILDFSIKGRSIFGRKKPHSQKTLKRIVAGLEKYGGEAAKPFLVMMYGTGLVRDIERPLPTITAGGQHIALCQPELQPFVLGQQSCSAPRSTDEPLPTVATSGAIALVEPTLQPFLISIDQQGSGDGCAKGVDEPVSTITTKARHCLVEPEVEPFLVHSGGPKVGERSISEPLNTVLTREHMALVQPTLTPVESSPTPARPFLVTVGGPEGQGRQPKSIDDPLPTVLTDDRHAIVQPFLMAINHKDKTEAGQRCFSTDQPLGTLTTKGSFALIETNADPANQSDDELGVVTINGKKYRIDIKLRMLEPKELAAAHSQESVVFQGSRKDVVKQIGNSVPSSLAEALCGEILARHGGLRDDVVDVDAEIRALAQAEEERVAAAA